jgi:hypothetical protein
MVSFMAKRMPGWSLRTALAALLLALASAAVSPAQQRPSLTPLFIRITGYLGPKRDIPILVTSWRVNRGRDVYDLHVTKLDVLSGNVAYFEIVQQLVPYDIAFSIFGDDEAIAAFLAAPPGQPIVILGYLRIDLAARTLMMSSVEPLAASTPSPGAPTSEEPR